MKKLIAAMMLLAGTACGGSGGFSHLTSDFILAADGKSGRAGYLYAINRHTGDIHYLFPMEHAIRGMAFAPDGTLYGISHDCFLSGGLGKLLRIAPETGEAEVVGPLKRSGDSPELGCGQDIEFVGDTLYAKIYDEGDDNDFRLFTVDLDSGEVTPVGSNTFDVRGGALISDGEALYAMHDEDDYLTEVDLEDGSFDDTEVIIESMLANESTQESRIGNATRAADGTVYARRNDYDNQGQLLITVDLDTGATEKVLVLPPGVTSIVAVP